MRNSVINWRNPCAAPARRRSDTMAHRRRLVQGPLMLVLTGLSLLAILLGGTVFIANQVTLLRTDIASLEDREEFLEADWARLNALFNAATSAEVICRRASEEIGLVAAADPNLVLVRVPDPQAGKRRSWLAWLDGFGGGDPARAADGAADDVFGVLVSLTPRQAGAAEPVVESQP